MRKSTLSAICGVLLAGLLTVTAGIGSAVNGKWFKNSDIKTWFNGWGHNKVQPDKGNADTNQDGEVSDSDVIVSDGEDNGISLTRLSIASEDYEAYGVNPLALSAFQLIVTTEPSNSIPVADFSADFKIENGWAVGKTRSDYISLSNIKNDRCTVSCLAPFGDPIIVTATVANLNDNTYLTSTCRFDYLKSISQSDINISVEALKYDTSTGYKLSCAYGVGTITPEAKVSVKSFEFTNDFLNTFDRNRDLYYAYDSNEMNIFVQGGNISFGYATGYVPYMDDYEISPTTIFLYAGDYQTIFEDYDEIAELDDYFIYTIGKVKTPHAKMTFNVKMTYDGKTYADKDIEVSVSFDSARYYVTPTSSKLNSNHFVFGT